MKELAFIHYTQLKSIDLVHTGADDLFFVMSADVIGHGDNFRENNRILRLNLPGGRYALVYDRKAVLFLQK